MHDWSPYLIGTPPRLRPLSSSEGIADRLRYVAFAERQACVAFNEAAAKFSDAPAGLAEAWCWVAREEKKHEEWLVARLNELGYGVADLPVSLDLYHSFASCESARGFAQFMSVSEERGRVAGERFALALRQRDPKTSELFTQIALEERAHVQLVYTFFGGNINQIK